MHSIFLSYRRSDSPGFAGRIYDHLREAFGEVHVFMDIDSISAGDNFLTAIARTLDECEVVLVVIGRAWITTTEAGGATRLDEPNDPVRLEIEKAFERGRLIIPVLVDGAMMPRPEQLPPSLRPLTIYNAVSIQHHTFGRDVHALVANLRKGILAPPIGAWESRPARVLPPGTTPARAGSTSRSRHPRPVSPYVSTLHRMETSGCSRGSWSCQVPS